MAADPRSAQSPQNLQDLLKQLQSQALAPGSRPKYASTWKRWSEWFSCHGFDKWLPADAQQHSLQLALFAIHYWYSTTTTTGKPLSTNTVLSAISHISWYHMRERGYSVGLHAGHKSAVRGMQRMSPPSRQKQPVTRKILQELRSRCNFKTTHDRVLWGAAVMGFFFLLRRSEYLADGKRIKPYIIRTNDVKFLNKEGLITESLKCAEQCPYTFGVVKPTKPAPKRQEHCTGLDQRGCVRFWLPGSLYRSQNASRINLCCARRVLEELSPPMHWETLLRLLPHQSALTHPSLEHTQ